MARRNGPYQADFPRGSRVRIVDRATLQKFMSEWKFHHPFAAEQLTFGGRVATVRDLGYYHGGDELYWLDEAPGTWHEACLEPVGDLVNGGVDS